MQRHRFYASPSNFAGLTVTLDTDQSHHLARVLRLSEGARVFVFDGEGAEYECVVVRAGKDQVELNIVRELTDIVESPLQLTLAQALIKGDRFDWIVQKTTELGVFHIIPLITDHSEIRRAEERTEHRVQRWRRISLEALKQCGRRKLVEITDPITFADFPQNKMRGTNLIFSERGGISLSEAKVNLVDLSKLNIYIAPEGGWSDKELRITEEHGFIPVYLGPRVLRAETAAITAVTLVQHHFGDMK